MSENRMDRASGGSQPHHRRPAAVGQVTGGEQQEDRHQPRCRQRPARLREPLRRKAAGPPLGCSADTPALRQRGRWYAPGVTLGRRPDREAHRSGPAAGPLGSDPQPLQDHCAGTGGESLTLHRLAD
jgi:hypothetical protein